MVDDIEVACQTHLKETDESMMDPGEWARVLTPQHAQRLLLGSVGFFFAQGSRGLSGLHDGLLQRCISTLPLPCHMSAYENILPIFVCFLLSIYFPAETPIQ